jgi:hypothetical protein
MDCPLCKKEMAHTEQNNDHCNECRVSYYNTYSGIFVWLKGTRYSLAEFERYLKLKAFW